MFVRHVKSLGEPCLIYMFVSNYAQNNYYRYYLHMTNKFLNLLFDMYNKCMYENIAANGEHIHVIFTLLRHLY